MAIKKLLEPPGHLSEPVSQGPWGSGEMRLGSKICNDRAATRATTPWRPGRHNVQTHVFYKNRVCVWVRVMKYKWVTCILCVRVWMRMNQCVHVVENIYACMNMYMCLCVNEITVYTCMHVCVRVNEMSCVHQMQCTTILTYQFDFRNRGIGIKFGLGPS